MRRSAVFLGWVLAACSSEEPSRAEGGAALGDAGWPETLDAEISAAEEAGPEHDLDGGSDAAPGEQPDGGFESDSGPADDGGPVLDADSDALIDGGTESDASDSSGDQDAALDAGDGTARRLLLLVDRSGSMIGPSNPIDCRSPINQVLCELTGIRCSDPAYASTTYCGGSQLPVYSWNLVAAAVPTFARTRASALELGLYTFPALTNAPNTCLPGHLDVALGRQNGEAISDVLQNAAPFGATPTAPALTDALAYLASLPATQSSVTAAVIITDGSPNCTNQSQATQSAGALVQAKAMAQAGVPLHVVGFSDADATESKFLAELAEAGGTATPRLVETAEALSTALQEIAATVLAP